MSLKKVLKFLSDNKIKIEGTVVKITLESSDA